MENSHRARSGKPRIQTRGRTYVEPKVVSQGLQRVREAARRDSSLRFTCLLHHVTVELLREAYKALNPKAAPGVDGMTWSEYGKGLEERLRDLYGRMHRGGYRAQPSKRTYIYKDDGRLRPLGIAALEDKIVQLAVVWVLQAIYEEDFLGFSYGFRPGRSQHNALDAVWVAIVQRKVSWVLDADIRGFFGSIVHEWMIKFVEHRIGDKRIVRLIQKWLKAGVSEDGEWSSTVVGTPQGATVSPLLANIYLHYVLDLWVEAWRKRHARGEVYIVRYADDFVMGFTHICVRRRKDGRFTVRRKTIAKRLRRKVKEVTRELKRIRHSPVPEQGKWLRSVITGYYNYHAVPGNFQALNRFRKLLACAWLQALRRRSQKGKKLTWARMQKLLETWFPRAQILHPYPNQRLCVINSR